MRKLPTNRIRGIGTPVTMVAGAMGAGGTLAPMAVLARDLNWAVTISSVALPLMRERHLDYRPSDFEAARQEIEEAKIIANGNGLIGFNVLCAIEHEQSVRGAQAGGVDFIVGGAGLPLHLPGMVTDPNVALWVIVSSAKALRIICDKWIRTYGRVPDVVVVEGPLAGGHIGVDFPNLYNPAYQLENLVYEVREVAKLYFKEFGNIPIIAAGGIRTPEDIAKFVKLGAVGVQIATPFIPAEECGLGPVHKRLAIEAHDGDVIPAMDPGSPFVGHPFHVLRESPGYLWELKGDRDLTRCQFGCMLRNGRCAAKESHKAFCICQGLWHAANDFGQGLEICTAGYRLDDITCEEPAVKIARRIMGWE